MYSARAILLLSIFLFGMIKSAFPIRCFECVSRLGPGEVDSCSWGDERHLKRVNCIGPSVCATYSFQSVIAGTPSETQITRGCQAKSYGDSCEDIFHNLRRMNQVLPGQHTCTTCSTDLCNSGNNLLATSVLLLVAVVLGLIFK